MSISVLILTLNEEINLPDCLESVSWSDDVVVFDSFSTDRTVEMAKTAGARVVQRRFDNYAAQRNAALNEVEYKHPWVLMVDADERWDGDICREIESVLAEGDEGITQGRFLRKDMFLGRWLRRSSGYPTWSGRLVRVGHVSVERDINEEYHTDGKVVHFKSHFIHHPFNKGVAYWFERHNRYSSMEAQALVSEAQGTIKLRELLSSDPTVRRKCLKQLAYRLPCRPFLVFCYLYFFRMGFQDGIAGFTYCRLRAMYEYMIDLKVRELRRREKGYRHFFYGGAPGVAETLVEKLSREYPGLQIAGSYSPPYRPLSEQEDAKVVAMINAARPDIVWVGLGATKQEKWMAEHVRRIEATAMIGVGAAFDFHSANVKWAPAWIQKSGLEWAYRLAKEPRRMWRRNLDSPIFLTKVLGQRLRQTFTRQRILTGAGSSAPPRDGTKGEAILRKAFGRDRSGSKSVRTLEQIVDQRIAETIGYLPLHSRTWLLAACLVTTSFFAATHLPQTIVPLPVSLGVANRLLLHVIVYGALTGLWLRAYPIAGYWLHARSQTRRTRTAHWTESLSVASTVPGLILFIVALGGALEEFTQPLVGREARIMDWVANVAGACLAVGIWYAIKKIKGAVNRYGPPTPNPGF